MTAPTATEPASGADPNAASGPASGTGLLVPSGRHWLAIGALALIVVAYVVVAAFYNAEGGLRVTGGADQSVTGLDVRVEPVTVDAQVNQATVHLTFSDSDGSLSDDSGRLLTNTRVLIESGTDTQEVRFPAGSVLGQTDVVVWLDGELATYPFDDYSGELSVMADTYERNSDGSFSSVEGVYTQMAAVGGVNGWDTSIAIDNLPGSALGEVHFARAFSSQVFAVLLLGLAVLLALSVLVAGLLINTGRRRLEVALMSWAASLLFALPLLRNFMPNSPPIGAAIDIYVYLWVIVVAILGALLVVASWVNQGRPVRSDHNAGGDRHAA